MMSRLLALVGSGMLLALVAAAAVWAFGVASAQPPLPATDAPMATPETAATGSRTATARPRRPDVYYSAITERPLFAPTRRPLVPEASSEPEPVLATAPEPSPEATPAPPLRVLGVVGTIEQSRALVSNSGGDPLWLTEGQSIGGWQVSSIGPDWIEITLNSEKLRIEMYQQ